MTDETVTIPKLTAQILFDALCHSMDFGSGMLDTEEVEALRGMAVALGVDPTVATPDQFVGQYPHPFEPMDDPRQIEREFGLVKAEWQDRSAFGLPPGFVFVQTGAIGPGFTPCKAGWPRCKRTEDDALHAPARLAAQNDTEVS